MAISLPDFMIHEATAALDTRMKSEMERGAAAYRNMQSAQPDPLPSGFGGLFDAPDARIDYDSAREIWLQARAARDALWANAEHPAHRPITTGASYEGQWANGIYYATGFRVDGQTV